VNWGKCCARFGDGSQKLPRTPVTACGRICISRRKVNLSGAFAGQNVGIKEVAEKIWLVSLMQYDLVFFDHETGRVECAPTLRCWCG